VVALRHSADRLDFGVERLAVENDGSPRHVGYTFVKWARTPYLIGWIDANLAGWSIRDIAETPSAISRRQFSRKSAQPRVQPTKRALSG
jgi:hypothetical protein